VGLRGFVSGGSVQERWPDSSVRDSYRGRSKSNGRVRGEVGEWIRGLKLGLKIFLIKNLEFIYLFIYFVETKLKNNESNSD